MRRSLAFLFLPLVLAACGTTVPNATVAAGGQQGLAGQQGLGQPGLGDSGLGSAPGSAPGAVGLPGSGTSAGPGGTLTSAGPGTTAAGGQTATGSTGAGAGAPAGVQARGVTATTIKIGAAVETGTAAAAEAFGIKGAGTMSQESVIRALIADVNGAGGILGRKVEVVFHQFDTAQALSNPDATVAAICARYRDDDPVFAVLFHVPMPGLRKCLAEMGSPFILTQNITSTISERAYRQYGGSYLYGINSITTERLAELFIPSLEQRSFHEKWNTAVGGPGGVAPTKLGVIHSNTPDTNDLYAAYARELARVGRKFEETVTYPNNAQDAAAATQAAVLRFKTVGVTHVYGASVLFMQAAESQEYRPRYAYLPGLGAFGVANAPAMQMKGAMTVGWLPMKDVNDPQDPGPTAGAARCLAVMKKAGLSTANRQDRALMFNLCDGVYALREAITKGAAPTVPALRRGYESLGSGFAAAMTFQAILNPSRHHGVDAVRDMAFNSECSCLVYTSRTNRR